MTDWQEACLDSCLVLFHGRLEAAVLILCLLEPCAQHLQRCPDALLLCQ